METRRLDLSDAEVGCGDSAMGRVRRAYGTLAAGERLEVLTGVAEHVFAVRAWSRRVGGEVVEESRERGLTRLVLQRPAA
ncbi:MAG: sulfurtransferase TusA family protein [Candidatus Dormibacteria bacterium]